MKPDYRDQLSVPLKMLRRPLNEPLLSLVSLLRIHPFVDSGTSCSFFFFFYFLTAASAGIEDPIKLL